MTSKVIYNGLLRTEAIHLKSSSSIETDAPTDNNGRGQRFSPTDLLATSLASCMLTVMGIKANGMEVLIDGITIEVLKKMQAEPRKVSGIDLKFHIPDNLSINDKKAIEILKHTALTCPVARSLNTDIEISIDWGLWT